MTVAKKTDLLVSALDLPADLGKNVPRLVLWGKEHLLIENYGGILAFSADELIAGNKAGSIVIEGENLVLEVLTKAEIEVCGKVTKITLTEAKDGED